MEKPHNEINCVFSINHLGLACHDLFTLVQKRDSSIKANIWLLLSGHFLPLTRMAILPIFSFYSFTRMAISSVCTINKFPAASALQSNTFFLSVR